jgi:hypothetical protein
MGRGTALMDRNWATTAFSTQHQGPHSTPILTIFRAGHFKFSLGLGFFYTIPVTYWIDALISLI